MCHLLVRLASNIAGGRAVIQRRFLILAGTSASVGGIGGAARHESVYLDQVPARRGRFEHALHDGCEPLIFSFGTDGNDDPQ